MSKDRRQYSEEFKREAVRLMTKSGVPLAQVSCDLGVCTTGSSATGSSATGSKVKGFPGYGIARDEELASAQGRISSLDLQAL